jgi:hypothetical protein
MPTIEIAALVTIQLPDALQERAAAYTQASGTLGAIKDAAGPDAVVTWQERAGDAGAAPKTRKKRTPKVRAPESPNAG